MKVRQGFVSNSSSSSFLIYGAVFGEGEIDKLNIWNKVENAGLYISNGPDYGDCVYIGQSWDKIKDDQTGKQFKEEVKELLNKLFNKPIECSTLSEAWYDG